MREILFRGKTSTGKWVIGAYYKQEEFYGDKEDAHEIITSKDTLDNDLGLFHSIVIPETVGEFTGLIDKNGNKIFEGDIIKSDDGKQSAVSVVKIGEYYPKMFYKMLDMFAPGRKHLPAFGVHAKSIDRGEEMILFQSPCVTIIGNIHDNPELLENP